ncbi:MAG TPA: 3-isopropylmalate dehydrogenase [Candidatus Diapherotrites archaeon]|uniref:3-isopropylmalate dehydrogenase n=1 Tax=Candidatus Iainarchaeum sp. TaxID=3101447 RepID=A0A7J4IWK2_9ARCH|nr:3-isopropylmalate dehydrogenase [Candidatus Diapherotrites archaeon]
MALNRKIAVLAGDGIGPEIVQQAVLCLKAVSDKHSIGLEFEHAYVGYAGYEKKGQCLPAETLELCRNSDSILLGAVGDPRADKLPPAGQPERGALLPLRKIFDLYANIRPAKIFPALIDASPLKREIIGDGFDFVTVRELTGDVYFGKKDLDEKDTWRSDLMKYSRPEVSRIAKKAFELARTRRNKVTSVDKANVLYASVLWRSEVENVHKQFSDVSLEHMYVDNCAMQIVKNPRQFDVIVTGNLFGDILSDESSIVTGSLGMLPSASLGDGKFGLYEPIHGSAPKYAGQDVANPIATILSGAMMLRYTFGIEEGAKDIEGAVEAVIEHNRTKDIMSEGKKLVGTNEMGKLVAKEIIQRGD